MKRLAVVLLLLIALPIAIVLLARPGAEGSPGTTITVNTTSDELNADGDCSLREAIQAANTDVAVDACTPGSGADLIILPTGTYTLSISGAGEDANAAGDLDITGDLSIDGDGDASTIIDGGALDRVLHIQGGAVVEISRVTVRNGSGVQRGGGIYNSGYRLTMDSSTVSGNSAEAGGGIFNSGSMTVDNSTLTGNTATSEAGGIWDQGNTTLTNVTVNDNTAAGDGGGILKDNYGLTVNSSTISGNASGFGAAGIMGGGGIAVNCCTVTLNNSTVSGNTVVLDGGGISHWGTTLTVESSTVSDNTAAGSGGGIYDGSDVVNLSNTIVAKNSSDDCAGGGITSGGHNLDSDGTCGLGAAGDLPNTDPLLGPLQDNGGPTQTHALLPDSPAIDAGDNSGCPATDQRGFVRPVDGDEDGSAICDIAAYEFGASPPAPVGGLAQLADLPHSPGDIMVAVAGLTAPALIILIVTASYARRRLS